MEERFWKKVDKKTDKECWEWTGARNNEGYGNMNIDGKYVNAHRVSYYLHFTDIPRGMFVCHKCDNPQ